MGPPQRRRDALQALASGCVAALLALSPVGCATPASPWPAGAPTAPSPGAGLAEPNPRLTPGVVFPNASAALVCRRGYARAVRGRLSRLAWIALKRRVYARYAIARHSPGAYEIDHREPLALGGTNSLANLWPQPIDQAREKDGLESWAHDRVCAGRLGLRTAQAQLLDWYPAWLRAGRPSTPRAFD